MPRVYVLDTTILVALLRGRGPVFDTLETEYHLTEPGEAPVVSVVSVGEMRALALKLGWKDRKQQQLDAMIAELVRVDLGDDAVIEAYARIDEYSEKLAKPPRRMGQNDMWIAATACAVAGVLLTADRDFDHLHPTFITRHVIDAKTGRVER